jgi:hypothetical protein
VQHVAASVTGETPWNSVLSRSDRVQWSENVCGAKHEGVKRPQGKRMLREGLEYGHEAALSEQLKKRDLSIKPECLGHVHHLHRVFPAAFINRLKEQRHEIPASTSSHNMYAIRHFVRSPQLAAELLSFLPEELGVRPARPTCAHAMTRT